MEVSRICLGTMVFGRATEPTVARRIIDKAFEQGVNFMDTADVYVGGRSEEVVGEAIAGRRDRWVLATKFGNQTGPHANQGGQSRKWIVESVEASLKRLGTDYIDVLYFHKSFADDHLPQAVRAIGDLIRQGKLRSFGISNFTTWRLAEVCRLADGFGIDRPVATQPLYNIVNRTAEVEHLPAAAHYGVGAVSYSPLARGVLTGKYEAGTAPDPDSRLGRNDMRLLQAEWRPESVEVSRRIVEHARAKSVQPADFALAWVLANDLVTSVIAGPRTEEQWDGYVRAEALRLGADDEALIDSLVPAGCSSTPGHVDPAYPMEGRVAVSEAR